MIVIFNEDRLDAIGRDLAAANNGERDADRRIRESHLPWLLHFARHTNEQVAAYEEAMEEEVVVEEAGIENVENAKPEVAEAATDLLEDENVASVTVGDVEDAPSNAEENTDETVEEGVEVLDDNGDLVPEDEDAEESTEEAE